MLVTPNDHDRGAEQKRTQFGAKEYSYDEAVELTGHGRYNYMQLATCSVIVLAVAMDMFGHSIAVAAAACDLKLSVYAAGVLASAPFAGLISAFPWGYYADTRGRRQALLVSTTAGFSFAALTSLAPTWEVFFGLKVLGCAFSTAAFTLTMTYVGECTSTRQRSRYLFIMNSANLSSDLVFFTVAYFILPLTFAVPIPWLGITFRPWRLYSLILAVPLGLGALMMLPLKESPKFLASRGKEDQALEVLRAMFERNGGSRGDYSVKALSTNTDQSKEESFWASLTKQTLPLFKPPFLWRTLQLFYLVAVCCSTNNVFIMWYPIMVNQFFNSWPEMASGVTEERTFCDRVVANISSEAVGGDGSTCNDVISPNTLISGIILGGFFVSLNLLATLAAGHRRLVFITSLLVPAVCLVLVNHVTDPIGNLVAFTLVQSTAIGIGCLASYFVDLYATSYRGLAWSLGMMVGRLTTLSGVNLVGAIIVDHCATTFYCWTVFVCSGLILALFLPSDTKTVK